MIEAQAGMGQRCTFEVRSAGHDYPVLALQRVLHDNNPGDIATWYILLMHAPIFALVDPSSDLNCGCLLAQLRHFLHEILLNVYAAHCRVDSPQTLTHHPSTSPSHANRGDASPPACFRHLAYGPKCYRQSAVSDGSFHTHFSLTVSS